MHSGGPICLGLLTPIYSDFGRGRVPLDAVHNGAVSSQDPHQIPTNMLDELPFFTAACQYMYRGAIIIYQAFWEISASLLPEFCIACKV